jgi:hypothetical protein
MILEGDYQVNIILHIFNTVLWGAEQRQYVIRIVQARIFWWSVFDVSLYSVISVTNLKMKPEIC